MKLLLHGYRKGDQLLTKKDQKALNVKDNMKFTAEISRGIAADKPKVNSVF